MARERLCHRCSFSCVFAPAFTLNSYSWRSVCSFLFLSPALAASRQPPDLPSYTSSSRVLFLVFDISAMPLPLLDIFLNFSEYLFCKTYGLLVRWQLSVLGTDPDEPRPRPNPLFARLPNIPTPLPYKIWMQLSAFHILHLMTARRVRLSPLLVCGAYVLCKTFHSLWSSAKIEQLGALTDIALARCGLCEGCRDKAFACRACMSQLYGRMMRTGSMTCHHERVTVYEANGEEFTVEVATIGEAD